MITYIRKLKQLSFSKLLPQRGYQTDNLIIIGLLGMHQTGSQKIITRQYRYLIIENSIHRKLAATFGALVDYVVVHQTGRMKQLQRDCRMKSSRRNSTIKTCHQ